MAVHDEQAEVATVELTGSGVDIILPPPAAPVRPAGSGRALVAVALHRWLERPLTDWLRRRWLPEAHASAS